ncbi:MAG: aspartate aminotransferase family protein [Candidatus Hadarchaeum sp.]|uniref:aspartate aminotransferase family protein n=1 Tax=Candidatus Hadarchaeum sp. TaxID=2883567 RepID=UPI003D0A2FBE
MPGVDPLKACLQEYRRRTPASRRIHARARKFLPGGNTRSVVYFSPYPFVMARGRGCWIYDVDGNRYLDFVNNYTSSVHGHAHPRIVAAIKEQLERGWTCAAAIESQHRLAEIICRRFRSVERIRFCNSGTEANMMAIRAARAYTGRDKILKMEGGYHGSYPEVEISARPRPELAGEAESPLSLPDSPGIPKGVAREVLVAPFNNAEAAERIIRQNRRELAAVIVEPMLGIAGQIPPRPGYLQFLREITEANDVLLIFDEVMTARLAVGGAQEFFGVTSDVTTFGKIIGGDLPAGAFGGREEVMELFSPERREFIHHAGTFNGNALAMVAGMATLKLLNATAIDRINRMGEYLAQELKKIFAEADVAARVTGAGSLRHVHFTRGEVVDYRSAMAADEIAARVFFFSLLNEGIFISPRGMFCISTPMERRTADRLVEEAGKIVGVLKSLSKR